MAKQPKSGESGKSMSPAEVKAILDRQQDLEAVTELLKALIVARHGAIEKMTGLDIEVDLITGGKITVAVPDLPNAIVTLDDPRLETFLNIVRISKAQDPTFYRLKNVSTGRVSKGSDLRQVSAS